MDKRGHKRGDTRGVKRDAAPRNEGVDRRDDAKIDDAHADTKRVGVEGTEVPCLWGAVRGGVRGGTHVRGTGETRIVGWSESGARGNREVI